MSENWAKDSDVIYERFAAGIDDAVGALAQDQFRGRAGRARLADPGLHGVRHPGPLQRRELLAHRYD